MCFTRISPDSVWRDFIGEEGVNSARRACACSSVGPAREKHECVRSHMSNQSVSCQQF